MAWVNENELYKWIHSYIRFCQNETASKQELIKFLIRNKVRENKARSIVASLENLLEYDVQNGFVKLLEQKEIVNMLEDAKEKKQKINKVISVDGIPLKNKKEILKYLDKSYLKEYVEVLNI